MRSNFAIVRGMWVSAEMLDRESFREDQWGAQRADIRALLELDRASAQTVFGHQAVEHAFARLPWMAGCSDGRCTPPDEHPLVRTVGNGVGMRYAFLAEAAMRMQRVGVRVVAPHSECGGVKHHCMAREISPEKTDAVAKSIAAVTAHLLQPSGSERLYTFGYSEDCDRKMTGLPGVHTERVIVVDDVGCFDPRVLLEGAQALTLSAAYLDPDSTEASLRLLIEGVAFGIEGYGDRFTPQDPLLLLHVQNPFASNLGTEWMKRLTASYQGRVRRLAFQAPDSVEEFHKRLQG